MIRRAKDADVPAIEAFVARHLAMSMFLASNLRDFGLNGSGHPRATRFWVADSTDGLTTLLGLSEEGNLLVLAPGTDPEAVAPLRSSLAGETLRGVSGEAGQVDTVISALGGAATRPAFDDTEPHFELQLGDLVVPEGAAGCETTLRAMVRSDLELVASWRHAFDCEVFGDGDLPEGHARSRERALGLIDTGRGRILERQGNPIAMTAFNAVTDHAVQIGSVYTPPELRGQSHARRAVALHLVEARRSGVTRAVLYSSGVAAARAYRAIGFRQIGLFRQVDYRPSLRLGDAR